MSTQSGTVDVLNVHTKSTTVWPGLNNLCFSLSCGALVIDPRSAEAQYLK
jgi:hypothetical protein